MTRGLDMADSAQSPKAGALPDQDDGVVWRWSLLVFISGFLIVALQIVWYRVIGVLLQSNGYSFSLVLSVLLLGDAAGLLVGARTIDRIADPRRFFFLMQGVATTMAPCGAWFVYLAIGAGLLPSDFVDENTMCCGYRNAALVAFLVAGLLLLDLTGTTGTLKLLVAIGLAFAVLQLLGARSTRWAWLPAAVLAAGLALFPGGEAFWRRLHGLAVEKAIVAEDKTGLSLLKLENTQDGKLYIQGHSQSHLPFHTVHAFLGAIGPLTHPAPRRILVIGSGTGGTPYAAGLNPGTEQVQVIEIVVPVIATWRDYVAQGGRSGVDILLASPKFEIVVADGRHALALDPTRYDVIEADAILPKTALSGLLNSQEFYRQAKAKLAPGGLYVQWASTERSIETFRSVFPYVTMVHPAMIGSDRPIPYTRDKILELLARPEIDLHLAAARIDRGDLRKWFEDRNVEVLNDGKVVPAASPNTDFFPRDEYYLNRP